MHGLVGAPAWAGMGCMVGWLDGCWHHSKYYVDFHTRIMFICGHSARCYLTIYDFARME